MKAPQKNRKKAFQVYLFMFMLFFRRKSTSPTRHQCMRERKIRFSHPKKTKCEAENHLIQGRL